jgi:O-antigen/teichoic acid export membrane protein
VNHSEQTLREYLTGLVAWHPGGLAKGALAMTAAMGLRTIAQAIVFLIVARVLGVEAYGAYAAVLTIAGALGNFAGSGTQILLLRDAARDPARFPLAWGRVLTAIALSSNFLLGIYLVIAWAILPAGISWPAILLIGLAELLFAPLAQAGVSAYQGHERIFRAARLVFIPALLCSDAATFGITATRRNATRRLECALCLFSTPRSCPFCAYCASRSWHTA